MPRRVVYILGAGFSAPLGLPVIANFIRIAKDLYQEDPGRYQSFESIFQILRSLAPAKNSFEVDCDNIEEVLSILELEAFAGGENRVTLFTDFLAQVLGARMPVLEGEPFEGGRKAPNPFISSDGIWRLYANFFAQLRNLVIRRHERGFLTRSHLLVGGNAEYSLLSLNYDPVVERLCAMTDDVAVGEGDGLEVVTRKGPTRRNDLVLAKLHGSMEDGSIVPPTWNKGSRSDVTAAWAYALHSLRRANHIRILGYSLPETDAYMRFLFKSAAVDAPNLQRVDVICLDSNEQSVEERYRAFAPKLLRFANKPIENYLQRVADSSPMLWNLQEPAVFNRLEETHELFMPH